MLDSRVQVSLERLQFVSFYPHVIWNLFFRHFSSTLLPRRPTFTRSRSLAHYSYIHTPAPPSHHLHARGASASPCTPRQIAKWHHCVRASIGGVRSAVLALDTGLPCPDGLLVSSCGRCLPPWCKVGCVATLLR